MIDIQQEILKTQARKHKVKVLLSAPVITLSGYGVHSRMIADALMQRDDVDLFIRATKWGETPFLYGDDPVKQKYMENIKRFNDNPDQQFDVSLQITIPHEFDPNAARYNVGITAGIEVDRITTKWIQSINTMDQLIVPSEFTKGVTEGTIYQVQDPNADPLRTRIITETIFEGIDTSIFNPENRDDSLYEFETPFNFLFVGQWGKGGYGEDRKNISKLITQFCKAFKDKKDVGLILKMNSLGNHAMDKNHLTRRLNDLIMTAREGSEYPKVHFVHGYLTDDQLAQLYNHKSVKAFVSLHHGEGYGLTLAQAAMCDVPIIATDWSAPKDFLDKGKWIKLPCQLVEIPPSFYWEDVAEKGARWAEVDEEETVRALRRFKEKSLIPMENAKELGAIVREEFSLDKFYQVFNNSFDDIKLRFLMRTPEFIIQQINSDVDKRPSIAYVMPRHAGDVFNSTIVVDALRKKYPDHFIYFITSREYMSIVANNPNIHKVMEYVPHIHDNLNMMKEIFDIYYTPHFDVQYQFSNWMHKNNMMHIIDKMAQHCHVEISKDDNFFIDFSTYNSELKEAMEGVEKYVVLHAADNPRQGARIYHHWDLILENIEKLLPDHKVLLIGEGRPVKTTTKNSISLRGLTNFQELAQILSLAKLFVGIDSLPAHLANHLDVPSVVLFGSSYYECTGPYRKKETMWPIETEDRHGCGTACYKNECVVSPQDTCLNTIEPQKIFDTIQVALNKDVKETVKITKTYPKISGYTTSFNCKKAKIPFEYAIKSALQFCDEVVVADGGSEDGTLERLEEMASEDDRIVIEHREWDFTEPGIDGEMKAFARLMCSNDILWQFDADEIMHEDDVEAIKDLAYRLNKSGDLILSLPVVELWGSPDTMTGRRHCWKWRLSKHANDITHGIPDFDRRTDKKTGRIFSSGQSDGCFYVNPMTYKVMPHNNFYTQHMEDMRKRDADGYAKEINHVVESIPSVWHTSWLDLDNKIDQFKTFWTKQWSLLYQKNPSENRFFPGHQIDYEASPEERKEVVKSMIEAGGEAQDPIKFSFKINKKPPKYLLEWIESQ